MYYKKLLLLFYLLHVPITQCMDNVKTFFVASAAMGFSGGLSWFYSASKKNNCTKDLTTLRDTLVTHRSEPIIDDITNKFMESDLGWIIDSAQTPGFGEVHFNDRDLLNRNVRVKKSVGISKKSLEESFNDILKNKCNCPNNLPIIADNLKTEMQKNEKDSMDASWSLPAVQTAITTVIKEMVTNKVLYLDKTVSQLSDDIIRIGHNQLFELDCSKYDLKIDPKEIFCFWGNSNDGYYPKAKASLSDHRMYKKVGDLLMIGSGLSLAFGAALAVHEYSTKDIFLSSVVACVLTCKYGYLIHKLKKNILNI